MLWLANKRKWNKDKGQGHIYSGKPRVAHDCRWHANLSRSALARDSSVWSVPRTARHLRWQAFLRPEPLTTKPHSRHNCFHTVLIWWPSVSIWVHGKSICPHFIPTENLEMVKAVASIPAWAIFPPTVYESNHLSKKFTGRTRFGEKWRVERLPLKNRRRSWTTLKWGKMVLALLAFGRAALCAGAFVKFSHPRCPFQCSQHPRIRWGEMWRALYLLPYLQSWTKTPGPPAA